MQALGDIAKTIAVAIDRDRVEAELQQNLADLERFNRLVIGREEKMIQLKQEINELENSWDREKGIRLSTSLHPAG